MRRRSALVGLLAGFGLAGAYEARAQAIDIWGLLQGRPFGSERLKLEIGKLNLAVQLAMMVGNKAEAKRLALQLPMLSRRDPDWYKYPDSFKIALVLVSLTDPRDRDAWIFANQGLLECFPAAFEGDLNQNFRALAKASHDLLIADAAGPARLSKHIRMQVAGVGLSIAAFAPGRERGLWAAVARQEYLTNPQRAAYVRAVNADGVTARFLACGAALAGDWKAAAREYDVVLVGSIGAMDSWLKPRSGSTTDGLASLIAGATTVEAEAATAFAMSGEVDRALEVLERARRNTGLVKQAQRSTEGEAPTAMSMEARLLATGATVVQPVTSLLGAFALVSVRRKGKTVRFSSFSAEPGGYELMGRLLNSRTNAFTKNGLLPAYQRIRRSRAASAQKQLKDYVDRAAKDAEILAGSVIRTALSKASVSPQDDVVVVLPGNLALLPIALASDGRGGPALGQQYRLRWVDSLQAAISAFERAKLIRNPPTLGLVLPDPKVADLAFLGFERASVTSLFPSLKVVDGALATSPAAVKDLDGTSHWHFSSHAAWNFKDPGRSGVALGVKTTLTLDDVTALSLANPPRLVFLSACETGFIDIDRNLDTFRGLLGTFVTAGAAGAIGSLWPVSDAATSLLVARFYDEHIGAKKAPAEALRSTQAWLSQASVASLSAYVAAKVAAQKIRADDAAAISSFLAEKLSNEAVFRHPYYWGGFQLYGA